MTNPWELSGDGQGETLFQIAELTERLEEDMRRLHEALECLRDGDISPVLELDPATARTVLRHTAAELTELEYACGWVPYAITEIEARLDGVA